MTIRDIMALWEQKAPLCTAEEWDNPGLLVGDPEAIVTGVVTTLDITREAVELAVEMGANLIISHHPVIFSPLKRLTADSVPYLLAKHGIAALCLHTNLDKAVGGVNDILIARLGWPVAEVADDGLCRIVTLDAPISAAELVKDIAAGLHTAVRVLTGERPIQKIAVCSGSGGDCLLPLCDGVDAILTGEIKHHEWLAFADAGITAIDAGHYATEVMAADLLAKETATAFPDLDITAFSQPTPYETVLS